MILMFRIKQVANKMFKITRIKFGRALNKLLLNIMHVTRIESTIGHLILTSL